MHSVVSSIIHAIINISSATENIRVNVGHRTDMCCIPGVVSLKLEFLGDDLLVKMSPKDELTMRSAYMDTLGKKKPVFTR